jgi:hypothetical protein
MALQEDSEERNVKEVEMGAFEIILLIVMVVLLAVSMAIHYDRKKTRAVYQFMADMVSEEGGALQQALEDLKVSSKYADPAESAAAITEIVRFLESFNSTVRKQADRIEEQEKNKWYRLIIGLLKKKKKVDYAALLKKKTAEKKKPEEEEKKEEEEGPSLEEIEKKIAEKTTEPEKVEEYPAEEKVKPKKIRKLKKRLKRPRPLAEKPEGDTPSAVTREAGPQTPGAEEKKTSGDADTDIDLEPPSDDT